MLTVSVITVAYNSESTISKTIESVLNQTYKCCEYIIIDGASQDKTAEVAESYRPQFDEKGIKYTIISEKDSGMYDALNKGANLATGDLVGQINADDWYETDAVEKMVALFEKENCDVAWGSLNVIKPSGNMVKRAKLGKLWTTTGWCHPAMFSKREILLEFPYALENMYDDFDYITRVHLAKKKICVTEEIIANFNFGGMSTKKSFREAMERVNTTYSIYKRHGMSKLYYLHRLAFETVKYILG